MGFIFAIIEWIATLTNILNRLKYFIYPITSLYMNMKLFQFISKSLKRKK